MTQSQILTRDARAYALREGLEYRPHPLPVDRLSLFYSEAPTELSHVLYDPVFCLVLSGEKRAEFNGTPTIFGEGQGLVVSLDLPAQSWITRASPEVPYLALAVRLDPALLRELAHASPLPPEDQPVSVLASAPASAALVDVCARLFSLVGQPGARDVLAPLWLRELHYLLLTSPQGGMLRRMAQAGSHVAQIAGITAHLRAHMDQPMRVESLARRAGMSATVFHQQFREITGTTPVQFLKRLRLLEAQRLLRAGATNVTQAALRVGYESPSQFSRDYRAMFGTAARDDRMGLAAE
ncbi:AraC family transcriptional regulator [Pseudooceanicola sp. CBS1P-1]|nr:MULTISPECIES: AraC family transcriptional regulator [Pseudooceanicola]MBT9385879.1 AraC family transcriptional regulator [Pseudooceanicola endophyticus]